MTELNDNYWSNRYLQNQTGWDMKQPSPPLVEYINNISNKQTSILIPGCGNAYEAEYLLQHGFTNVTLIDISKTLVDSLKEKFNGKSIRIIHDDFFNHFEKYDLMIEQTFFCAIDPQLRNEYAKHAASILKAGGKIAGVLFNKTFEQEGPPFGGNKTEYENLFQPYFTIEKMEPCNNSILPRAGTELFFELIKRDV